jgi:hypothetical protein
MVVKGFEKSFERSQTFMKRNPNKKVFLTKRNKLKINELLKNYLLKPQL